MSHLNTASGGSETTTPPVDPEALQAARGADIRLSSSSPFSRVRRSRWRHSRDGLAPVMAVAAGGAVGGPARYAVDRLVPTSAAGFPWSTFAANVAGSFCLALLLVLIFAVWPPTRYLRPFVAVGVLGSFTTFSTWMVQTDQLLVRHDTAVATTYLAASVVAGMAAASLGLVLGRGVATRRCPTSSRGSR